MKKLVTLSLFIICLGTCLHAEAYPVFGRDSVKAEFFRDRYISSDLGHYLDNYSDYVVYEAETTGEWNLSERQVFSTSGNSFRSNRFYLNDYRLDSRLMPGSTPFRFDMRRTDYVLDYHAGYLRLSDARTQTAELSLTGNTGGLGGISPGTKELINLFHSSGAERTMDNRPLDMRNHITGAGTLSATILVPYDGVGYAQHVTVDAGQRLFTAFDEKGITALQPSLWWTAQTDGALPLKKNNVLDRLNYVINVAQKQDAFSELLYNANETARLTSVFAAAYGGKDFSDGSVLTAGLTWESGLTRHNDLSFSRNIVDHDGEAFEPWYPDGNTHALSLNAVYRKPLLTWLRLECDASESVLFFRPTTTQWSNEVYYRNIDGVASTPLYTVNWTSRAFAAGLIDNEALLVAEYVPAPWVTIEGRMGLTLDGILLRGKSIVSPDFTASFAADFHPTDWFEGMLSLSHHRMSYTSDEVRYLSSDYISGEMYYPDGTLFGTTGGNCRTPEKGLCARQPSYVVLDIPLVFRFGKSRRHAFSLLSSIRKYYNQWHTSFTDGVDANMFESGGLYYYRDGVKNYTVCTQPRGLMDGKRIGDTPYYMSNVAKYSYTGKKVLFSASWQSYLMAGLSSLGNGPLHNNIGGLSESLANPNTYMVAAENDLPYQGNTRLNQDRSFIARIQLTYNVCDYLSLSMNGKFKDGQPFSTFLVRTYSNGTHTQAAMYNNDDKGINMANGTFGKREDAFFNIDFKATGRWWVKGLPMSLEVMCYNIYDFGTALTEYIFDEANYPTYSSWTAQHASMQSSRTSMSLCIPRGLLFTFRIGLQKDENHSRHP